MSSKRNEINPEQQRAALAAYFADRPQLAEFARDMLRAFEVSEEEGARARLAAAGAARKEWKEYERHMPEVILDARDAGVSGAEIARELGTGESYVFRILRTKTRYSYRLDVYDDPRIGPGWQTEENGDGIADISDDGTLANPAALVEEIRRECLGKRRAHLGARVLLWHGADLGEDDDAVYAQEWPAAGADEQ
ncbi:hypothetical protein [Streptomyces noursei]|uniref:hypothetical protein n=1 Tax=Streptomyces noursei TaxID=1971 RepID=UPI001966BFCC|nr:hypothetical protein [Streptomyces noursei]QRX93383.1 hypothetical protein JNO44_23220 [Streptomyces noursei]